jgi:hypothetical protein
MGYGRAHEGITSPSLCTHTGKLWRPSRGMRTHGPSAGVSRSYECVRPANHTDKATPWFATVLRISTLAVLQ